MTRRPARPRAARRGAVLMEYVLVNVLIALPLLVLWHTEIFNFTDNKWQDKDLKLGIGIQAAFQRTLSGIALPIP